MGWWQTLVMGASHGLCLGDGGGCFGVDGVHQGGVGGHGGTGVRVAWCGGDVCLSAVNVLRRKRYLNRFHGILKNLHHPSTLNSL